MFDKSSGTFYCLINSTAAVLCNRIGFILSAFVSGRETEAVLINKQKSKLPGAVETLASHGAARRSQLQEEIPADTKPLQQQEASIMKPQPVHEHDGC